MHRMTILYPRFQFCFNQPDGAMGAGGGSSAVATPPVTPAAAQAPVSGVPGGSVTGTPPLTQTPSADDRYKGWVNPNDPENPYIPAHRYNEAVQRERARAEALQAKVRALMGIDAPEDPRKQQMREALLEVMPELREIGELKQTAGQGGQAEAAYWRRHGHEMSRTALAGVAKAMNRDVKDMPAGSRERVSRELLGFIRSDRTGERSARYEDGDPTLIEEFVGDLTGFWIQPARQASVQANAQNVERTRRLPQTGPAGGVPPAEGAPAPKTAKEVHERARQRFLASQGQ